MNFKVAHFVKVHFKLFLLGKIESFFLLHSYTYSSVISDLVEFLGWGGNWGCGFLNCGMG